MHDRIFSDPEVMRFVFGGAPLTKARSQEFFESAFDFEETGLKLGVLLEKKTAEIVGFSGLLACTVLGASDYEIGFVLSRTAWGKGFATEIGRGQLKYGFEEIGCTRLLAQVAPENTASIAVLKKIGLAYQQTIESAGRGQRQLFAAHHEGDRASSPNPSF